MFSDSSQPQVVEGSQGTGKEQREQLRTNRAYRVLKKAG